MDNNELEKMARFYLKKLYNNIPYIPVTFASEEEMGSYLGLTEYSEGVGYIMENDELLNAAEYSAKETEISPGIFEGAKYEPSYMDALNHPEIEIKLNDKLKDNINMLTGILLHELCHYWCWYRGFDHNDGDPQFERRLRELKLPSGGDYRYSKTYKRHISTFDFNSMEGYVRMYQEQ